MKQLEIANQIVEQKIKTELLDLGFRCAKVLERARLNYLACRCPGNCIKLQNACDWSRIFERCIELSPRAYWSVLPKLTEVVSSLEAGQLVIPGGGQ